MTPRGWIWSPPNLRGIVLIRTRHLERAEFEHCSSISPQGIVFPDVWPFSDESFIVFVPPTTVLGQPVRLRFDLSRTKF